VSSENIPTPHVPTREGYRNLGAYSVAQTCLYSARRSPNLRRLRGVRQIPGALVRRQMEFKTCPVGDTSRTVLNRAREFGICSKTIIRSSSASRGDWVRPPGPATRLLSVPRPWRPLGPASSRAERGSRPDRNTPAGR
jgi:hypothetical protein